jgi:hypothetical protein
MSNLFDCGIETVGVVANTTFSDNTITRTGPLDGGGQAFCPVEARADLHGQNTAGFASGGSALT